MLKFLSSAFVLIVFVSHAVCAQEKGAVAKLEKVNVLSKDEESYSYAKIFKKYQAIIFARIQDCSTCLTKDAPWIQLIRDKRVPACFVFMNKSVRIAKYFYEINSLPFEFYCDTSHTTIQLVTKKDTPVVLLLDDAGSQIFFDNPLSEIEGLIDGINSIESKRKKK